MLPAVAEMQTNASSWSTALRTPQILCFALLVSTFIYGGLILSGMLPRGEDEALRWVLSGIGLFGAIASFAIPGMLWKNAPPIQAESRDEIDPDGQAMFRDAAPTRKVVTDPKAVRRTYTARRFTPFILSLALSEIPAIMGLMTWMTTSVPVAACLVLVAFSSTLIVLRFPFPKRWRADAEARVGALIPD